MARLAGIAALVLLLTPVSVAGAGALAPEYTSSEPADGEELHQAPETVTITFSEPLDEAASSIEVEDRCGNQIDDGNVQVSLNEMSVGIEETPSGRYTVSWVASGPAGVTGTSRGSFAFTVHAGRPCDGSSGGGNHMGHGGHQGNEGGRGEHRGGHGTGHGGKGSEHEGTGHITGGHGGSGSDHGGTHMSRGGSHASMNHGSGGHKDGHGGRHAGEGHGRHHGGARSDSGTEAPLASGTPLPRIAPDSVAVLLALLLCAAFGILGGWVLRVSAPK